MWWALPGRAELPARCRHFSFLPSSLPPQKSPRKRYVPGLATAARRDEHKSFPTASRERIHSTFCESTLVIPGSQSSGDTTHDILLFSFNCQTPPSSHTTVSGYHVPASIFYLRSHRAAMMDKRTMAITCNSTLTAEKGLGEPLELKRLCEYNVSLKRFRWEMGVLFLFIIQEVQHTEARTALRPG